MRIEPCEFKELSETEIAASFPDPHAPDLRIVGSDEDGWRIEEVVSLKGDRSDWGVGPFPTAEAARTWVRDTAKSEGLGE